MQQIKNERVAPPAELELRNKRPEKTPEGKKYPKTEKKYPETNKKYPGTKKKYPDTNKKYPETKKKPPLGSVPLKKPGGDAEALRELQLPKLRAGC